MKLKTLFLLLALSPFALLAENDIQSALHNPVAFFSEDNEPLKAVLQSLGRAHGISIVTDEDVEGMVQVEMNNTTVKGVLDAILRPGGYFYEIQDGWISVSRFKTVLYTFDYPQITRSGSSSSTISMGGKSSNGSGQMNSSGSGAASGGGSGGGSGNGDTAQIQIQQKTASDFWQSVETQIKSMLGKDETFVINQFSGIVQVKGSAETHRNVANFIYQVNDRIGAQVEILAKIVEVRLTNQKKLGIDWQAAEFSIGNNNQVHVGSPVVPPAGTTADGSSNAIQGLSGVTNLLKNASGIAFSPDTFAGTIGAGKVDVVIRALEEQGDVKVTSQPRLRLLNNQTGYIKDSTDQAFFSKTSSVTINLNSAVEKGSRSASS